jgi:hypothetical protein
MAAQSCAPIAIGDRVVILPRDATQSTAKLKTASVTYVGPVYIRLSDGSAYSTIGLEAVRGNEDTRIEVVR